MPLTPSRRFGVKPEAAGQADKRKRKEIKMFARVLLILLFIAAEIATVVIGRKIAKKIMPDDPWVTEYYDDPDGWEEYEEDEEI